MGYWWQYIKYFWYLARNWNTKLAMFVTWHEIAGERKYKSYTTGIDDLRDSIPAPDWLHASIYQPVNFYTAEKLFEKLEPDDLNSAFLDAGCGKGRMLAVAAAKGFRHVLGFDLSPKMIEASTSQVDKLHQKFPDKLFALSCSNAKTYEIPPTVGVIFLFNPFDNIVMQQFVQQVMKSLTLTPRRLLVLYANPVYKDSWLDEGFAEIYQFNKMQYMEGCILEYVPNKEWLASCRS